MFLNESKDKLGVDFLEACMEFLDAKVEVKGIENLPERRIVYLCVQSTRWEDRMEWL